jgi:hypothetical protein
MSTLTSSRPPGVWPLRSLGFAATLLFVEGVLRWAGLPGGWRIVADPDIGRRPVPGTVFSVAGGQSRINGQGYHDEEWPGPEVARSRIAVLGNSITFEGLLLPAESWTGLLESALNAEAPTEPAWLVMNFAVPGFRLEDMLRCYRREVRGYRPQLAIFAITAWDVAPPDPSPSARSRGLYQLAQHSATAAALAAIPKPLEPTLKDALDRRWYYANEDPLGALMSHFRSSAFRQLEVLQSELEADGCRLALLLLPSDGGSAAVDGPWIDWAAERNGMPGRSRVLLIRAAEPFAREREATRIGPGTGAEAGLDARDFTVDGLYMSRAHLGRQGHGLLARCVLAELRRAGLVGP